MVGVVLALKGFRWMSGKTFVAFLSTTCVLELQMHYSVL